MLKIRDKTPSAAAGATQGEGEDEREQKDADGIVPVEQLKSPRTPNITW